MHEIRLGDRNRRYVSISVIKCMTFTQLRYRNRRWAHEVLVMSLVRVWCGLGWRRKEGGGVFFLGIGCEHAICHLSFIICPWTGAMVCFLLLCAPVCWCTGALMLWCSGCSGARVLWCSDCPDALMLSFAFGFFLARCSRFVDGDDRTEGNSRSR